MRKKQYKILVGDFETTVYKGQINTEVWAAASVELNTEDVNIFHSIGELFDYYKSLKTNLIVYFHNLKFDGAFWLSYLLTGLKFKQAYNQPVEDDINTIRFMDNKDMPNNSFRYSISDMGAWYSITIKVKNKIIELRDSFKLLPFSVKRIGESFDTKHKKLDIEYKGLRYAGCNITDDEKKYIANDVLVVKEALEIMFAEGHDRLTIGSCCLAEYKKSIPPWDYKAFFPNVYEQDIEPGYGAPTVGDYIHGAYRGGWCYLVKGKEQKLYTNGTTADVNSLYPSMMHSESGNYYPVGSPTFWKGDFIPEVARRFDMFFFVRLKTRFYLKPGKLPFIQIKNNMLYKSTEMLETSDIRGKDGEYYTKYKDKNGNIREAIVTLTLTQMDFYLLCEQYDLVDTEILDGCYFHAEIGIFDDYINKYRDLKIKSKGAKREEAKLFLNNLYGKMASTPCSNFKFAYVKEDTSLGFYTVVAAEKKPGYIPVGAAITSYARCFTIRAAQANYFGPDKPGFVYADTDSIHCTLSPEEIRGITVHPKNFCCWKLESCWDTGFFVRQKTYIEHVIKEDCEPIEKPYYNVRCAGMPDRCKKLFLLSMGEDEEINDITEEEKEFLKVKRTVADFNIGLSVPGKLLPKRIPGGIVLTETSYEMR